MGVALGEDKGTGFVLGEDLNFVLQGSAAHGDTLLISCLLRLSPVAPPLWGSQPLSPSFHSPLSLSSCLSAISPLLSSPLVLPLLSSSSALS